MSGASLMMWEFFGTAILLLLGNGVCALNTLRTSAAKNSDWIVIALGWGMAVFVGASIADASGAHLNPAVTLMLAVKGSLAWSLVPWYVVGQLAGAFVGAIAAWAAFKQLFDANNYDEHGKETGANKDTGGIFFTAPAHPHNGWNVVTEFIGTFVLLSFIAFGPSGGEIGGLKYVAVAFAVVGIGLSLGSPTGYAINPVRDFGPRLAYAFVLPIKGKGSANWGYAWVPIVGPLLAAVATGLLALVAL
ncbi:aquaporin family protein [Corynebacterium sp. sy017]|uniref:MIP/aquaporin family protein n=1 Tax=unclassified Corynebacterium TaxID=2624378 RepID=UPI001185F31F|nr:MULTISPECIES: MIP/aquaporin family protein [unclassified Corynebacterium]MBP3089440.1 aquaporin family protein [Corynebacterium sp. sy017]QDZ43363.1 aquaporin family protein [Corynebacterium sp. sy039]TSD90876.1 aquaporin family protein [Corynebacterium sp. SY003]